jgi:hypothetical protein
MADIVDVTIEDQFADEVEPVFEPLPEKVKEDVKGNKEWVEIALNSISNLAKNQDAIREKLDALDRAQEEGFGIGFSQDADVDDRLSAIEDVIDMDPHTTAGLTPNDEPWIYDTMSWIAQQTTDYFYKRTCSFEISEDGEARLYGMYNPHFVFAPDPNDHSPDQNYFGEGDNQYLVAARWKHDLLYDKKLRSGSRRRDLVWLDLSNFRSVDQADNADFATWAYNIVPGYYPGYSDTAGYAYRTYAYATEHAELSPDNPGDPSYGNWAYQASHDYRYPILGSKYTSFFAESIGYEGRLRNEALPSVRIGLYNMYMYDSAGDPIMWGHDRLLFGTAGSASASMRDRLLYSAGTVHKLCWNGSGVTPTMYGDWQSTGFLNVAVGGTGGIKFNGAQVVGTRGATVADPNTVSGTATSGGWGFVSAAEMNTAITDINTIRTKLEEVIDRLQAHGLIA